MSRRDKIPDLLEKIRTCLKAGRYRITLHADRRMSQRDVTLPEALHVLRTGWHEKRKDQFQETYDSWNYAIRSQTIEDRSLRVVVAFDDGELVVVVTVIDLDSND